MSRAWTDIAAAVDASPRVEAASLGWVGADDSVSAAERVRRALPALGLPVSVDVGARTLDALVTRDEVWLHEPSALYEAAKRVRAITGTAAPSAPTLWSFAAHLSAASTARVVPVPRALVGAVVWRVSLPDAPEWLVRQESALQLPVPVWLDPDAAGDTPAVALVAPDRWPARLRDRWGAP